MTMLCLISVVGVAFAEKPVSSNLPDDQTERIGVQGPLEFNQTVFKLAWTAKPNDTYYAQEYLPSGERLEAFNQMLAIHLFIRDIIPDDAVQQKAAELTKRKKVDPICNYEVFKSPDGKSLIMDFLVGKIKDDRYTFVEFNVYRYQQVDLGNKKKALLIYTYCKRSYGADIKPFLNVLKDSRIDYINQMIATEIPKVIIQN
jgi:hypothetical protein